MEDNNNILKELTGRKNPFLVPENYFENFASNFEQKTGYEERPVVFYLKKYWKHAAVAAVALLLGGQFYFSNLEKNNNQKAEKYAAYILSQVDEPAMIDAYMETSTK